MKALLKAVRWQIEIGTRVALLGGIALGLGLGVSLVASEGAVMIFEHAGERVAALALLTSACGLLAALCFLPVEIGFAIVTRFWKEVALGRFYAISFGVGVLFVHGVLLLALRYQRDILAPHSLAWISALLLGAVVVEVAALRFWTRGAVAERTPRTWMLACVVVMLLALIRH